MDIKEFDNLLKENEKKIEDKLKNMVCIHKRMRNGKKCNTYIQNFHLEKKEEKEFLSKMQTITCSSGSYKMFSEIDPENKVFMFNGDCKDIVKDILMNEYHIKEDMIKFTGITG